MSSSRCLVSKLRELSLGKPHSTRCPGNMPQATGTQPHLPWPTPRWWFLLWGVLQAFPTQGSMVLLAQWLPQKLTSPGYPEPYVKGQESSTDIEAPEGYVVRLLFQDFDLEPSPDCERDSVTLTASGMDLGQFCGQQGSLLGRPPGQREFVSSGNSLRLTFSAPASEDKTPGLHKGFLALYQAVAVNYTQPINQATGGPKAIPTPGDNPTEIQSCCQEPYYEAKPSGTLTCTAQVPWKQTQKREEAPRCVPVCGRPVVPISQTQESLGASRAELGSFPWQALTSIYGRGGGALLGDRWVLTAAHTIYPKDSILLGRNRSAQVFLGHTDTDQMLELGRHPVRRVVVHPDYHQEEPHDFHGDIALLELERSVPLGPHLLPVCLPDREALYRPGRWGYVSGFGVEMDWLSTKLKYSRLPVAPRAACEAWLRERQRPEAFTDGMFCAGDQTRPQSVCQGDSGGAFVVWDDRTRRWVATGIVSWGIGCGEGYGFYTKVLDYVDWIRGVMEMGIPDHLTCLLRKLYAGQEATVRTGHGTTDWFQIGKGVCQGCVLSPCLFNLYAEYIMRNAGLEEAQAGIKIAGRNITNLRYADDTILMAESEEELKSFLMKVKEESGKSWLKAQHSENKTMASGPITSWQIDGETMETVRDFILGGFKITADGDCSHEIERCLLLGIKVVTNLDGVLKSRDITLPTKVHSQSYWFSQWSCVDVRVGL